MDNQHIHVPTFSSFLMAGYECTYALTKRGVRFDLLAATKHEALCRQDYQLIKVLGITTVREGLAWHQIDRGGGRYDFSRFTPLMRIAQEEGIQQLWDLNHFDYPAGLNPFSARFVTRFAAYAQRCVEVIRSYHSGPLYLTPINEISFWAFVGADVGGWAPAVKDRGVAFKQQLVRASIAAMEAIWDIDPTVHFIQVDPIFIRTPKRPSTLATRAYAATFATLRYQAWDMLSGRVYPELGGAPKYLDILGANYYLYNQEWIVAGPQPGTVDTVAMPWRSTGRISLAALLDEVYRCYGRPMVVSETGSWGALRARWWRRTLRQVDEARGAGLPLYGVCAYPVVDRPDWEDQHLTNSGLWDFAAADATCQRVPHAPTLNIIRAYQACRGWSG